MTSAAKFVVAGTPTGPEGAWDLSYAYYDPPADLAWDVSTAVYASKSFSVAYQDSFPHGVFFKPDGTKMYVLGNTGDDVNEYDLSVAWDVSSASYLQNFSVAAQVTNPQDFFFKPDGTKMYILGITGDAVYEYDLSTPWDVSSASYLQNFSVAAQEATSQGIFFKPDGTKMYVLGASGTDVNEYDLSSAWDISTASYLQNFSINAQETAPRGFFFKPDGTAFYMVGSTNDTVYQYTLGGFSVAAQETASRALSFKSDGTKMYVIGSTGDDVNEYDLSSAWDISTASYLQNFSVAAQESLPTGLFFKPDGTKMYVIGSTGDDVNEYDLSTPWDISTASYLQNFSVATEDTLPNDVFFKPDGTKMYVAGNAGDDINEYDLSTPWDISTASYLQNFSVAAQETFPDGIFFKPDGTKMYVVGVAGSNVSEYSLTTPWDISSASYLQGFNNGIQSTASAGIFFKDDGTQMFIIDFTLDAVLSYTLGPQP